MQNKNGTKYRTINSREDLLSSTSGDRMKVFLGSKSDFIEFIYRGTKRVNGQNGHPALDRSTFIQEVPKEHTGNKEEKTYVLWDTELDSLRYGSGGIHFNYDRTKSKTVSPRSDRHSELKTLVDISV